MPENLLDIVTEHGNLRNQLESEDYCLDNASVFSQSQVADLVKIYKKINRIKNKSACDRNDVFYDKEGKLIHVAESAQFSIDEIEYYSNLALSLKKIFKNKDGARERNIIASIGNILKGKIVLNLFIQPSPRTHRSFEAAAKILGADVINEKDIALSSLLSRKEAFSDAIRTFYNYADAFIIRAPWNYSTEESIFAQDIYDECKSVLNAGSGRREHPTQGLTDMTTVKEMLDLSEFKQLGQKKVVIIGTKYLRALRSFVQMLVKVSPDLNFVLVDSPDNCINPELESIFKKAGIAYKESSDLKNEIVGASIVYLACVNKKVMDYDNSKYFLSLDLAKKLNKNAVILHPLPRIDELDQSIDNLNVSGIWKQVENGKFLRAILLLSVFRKTAELERIIASV